MNFIDKIRVKDVSYDIQDTNARKSIEDLDNNKADKKDIPTDYATNNDIQDIETIIDIITPKNTAKGELVHITDALGLPVFETKTSGNVKQETTTGKNKLNVPSTFAVTLYQDINVDLPSGAYTISATNITTNATSTSFLVQLMKVGGTTQNQYVYFNDKKASFTLDEAVEKIRIYAGGGYGDSVDKTTTFTNLMIRLTSITDDTYEPFTNGASPNPEFPSEIEVIEGDLSYKVNGKNLFDKDNVEVGKYINENGEITSYYAYSLSDYIKIKPNTRYYYQGISDYSERGAFYDNNKVLISTFIESALTNSYVDTPSNARYIRFTIINTNGDIDNFQFEEGTQTTPYEPYQEQIVPLDLKGNWAGKINDSIKDYLVTDKKKYWLVKNVGKVVLDGSEEWGLNGENADYGQFKLLIINKAVGRTNMICNKFISKVSANENCIAGRDTISYIFITIAKSIVSFDMNAFKTWLSNNNVEVYYQLATPEIIELGELPEPIKTFEGVNNIQLLANLDTEIEVKYALDLKKYYDNKLAEISAQII